MVCLCLFLFMAVVCSWCGLGFCWRVFCVWVLVVGFGVVFGLVVSRVQFECCWFACVVWIGVVDCLFCCVFLSVGWFVVGRGFLCGVCGSFWVSFFFVFFFGCLLVWLWGFFVWCCGVLRLCLVSWCVCFFLVFVCLSGDYVTLCVCVWDSFLLFGGVFCG